MLFLLQVMVVTTHEGVPEEFYGAKLIGSRRSVLFEINFIFLYVLSEKRKKTLPQLL